MYQYDVLVSCFLLSHTTYLLSPDGLGISHLGFVILVDDSSHSDAFDVGSLFRSTLILHFLANRPC